MATGQAPLMPRAPRQCPARDCDELIVGSQRYCEDHDQPWKGRTTGQGSTRAGRRARKDCLDDARHRCQIQHPGCTGIATEAHHPDGIAATGRTRAQAVDNGRLVAACESCHEIETRKQSATGRARR